MKILRLCFKNLNSLAGEWDIDLTHPDYVSSGIFAIIGPTGAGKSTILDAVCLALYGQTPRLGRITQGENEIMSRQTGECYAEVEFETARGRFRCHWSQHRSRKQADGLLQSPRHEISEAHSGLILESKLKTVTGKVEEVTGMDFDRFTRSMLLAQGGFAAFLQARPDERAPILEQITGTAIYSRISVKVHEVTTEQRKRLAEMRAELDGAQLLSPSEEEALLLEKSELQRSETALTAAARIAHEALSWRERIAALEGELLQLEQDRLAFETRKAAAGPELARLALAGRALKLGGDHAHLRVVRSQQMQEQAELTSAMERLPRIQLDWQKAFEALELAESGLASAQIRQTHGAELIRMVRDLDVRTGEAGTQLQGLMADRDKTARQNNDYRQALLQCDQRLLESEGELRGITIFLAEHQSDAGLVEALTGIEQQLKSLKALDKQCGDTQAKLGRQAERITTATLVRDRSETAWKEACQAVSDAENRLAGIRSATEALLQGRDLSAWRAEAEALATRHNRLGMILATLERVATATPQLASLKLREEALGQQQRALAHREQTLTGESELREQVARQSQENVDLLNRVRSLEDDRRQLKDGAPCPLCGAHDHPYAAGNIPQLDKAQKALGLATLEVSRVRDQLSRIRLEQVAVDKDLQQAGRDRTELEGRLLADGTFCELTARELEISFEPDGAMDAATWRLPMLAESETCLKQLLDRRDIIERVEQKQQRERNARTECDTLKDRLAERDKARLAALLGHGTVLQEHARLVDESAFLQGEYGRVLREVEHALAIHGCGEIVPAEADQLLAALGARRNAHVQHTQARDRLEKVRIDTAAEREKQRALLAESEKTLNEKEQRLRERSALRDALVEQRLEQYGERNPDREEKLLADALGQAADLRESALRERNRLQAELAGLNSQIERLTLSITQRDQQLCEREMSFRARLSEAGFRDEALFLQACLPQERFDELSRWSDNLVREEAGLQTRQQDRRDTLQAELDKNLTDSPLALIREQTAAMDAQRGELQRTLGAVEQKLRQHTEQQQRQQDRLSAIELQKRECARWEQLHGLIGSSDGKKFRNFAQGLTFELMVAHANRQLQKMSDRYILVRDVDQPLELNVIDNYQAGEIRSTKNLSGGESFIASLALSLGLSSMASRNVRVDSLFLDEGFGTLDEDALETALETLSGLQQDGKLIGVISHVPALKERIGIQIQVETGSGGRSRISGPGVNQP